MKDTPMSRLKTSGKLAAILGVDQSTIANWANAGRIPCTRMGGWRRFYLPDVCAALGIDLDELRPGRGASPTPPAETEPDPATTHPWGANPAEPAPDFSFRCELVGDEPAAEPAPSPVAEVIPSPGPGPTAASTWGAEPEPPEPSSSLDGRELTAVPAPESNEPEYGTDSFGLSAAQVAKRIGKSLNTIVKWAKDGIIPAHDMGGRLYFIWQDVRAAVEARPPSYKGRKPDPDARGFNQVLHRLARTPDMHISDTAAMLSILTGLAPEEIRRRVDLVEFDYSDDEKAGTDGAELATDDLKTLVARYAKSKDPAVRAWIASIRRPGANAN